LGTGLHADIRSVIQAARRRAIRLTLAGKPLITLA
jgi:hypothetical protein